MGIWFAVAPNASIAAPPASKGTITGTVTSNGEPFAGATVQLYGEGGIDWLKETTSDSNGNYSFKKVNPGEYSVVALALSTSLVCQGSAPATVVGGQTTVVNVEMTCEVFPP
jgi:hypothetical protein